MYFTTSAKRCRPKRGKEKEERLLFFNALVVLSFVGERKEGKRGGYFAGLYAHRKTEEKKGKTHAAHWSPRIWSEEKGHDYFPVANATGERGGTCSGWFFVLLRGGKGIALAIRKRTLLLSHFLGGGQEVGGGLPTRKGGENWVAQTTLPGSLREKKSTICFCLSATFVAGSGKKKKGNEPPPPPTSPPRRPHPKKRPTPSHRPGQKKEDLPSLLAYEKRKEKHPALKSLLPIALQPRAEEGEKKRESGFPRWQRKEGGVLLSSPRRGKRRKISFLPLPDQKKKRLLLLVFSSGCGAGGGTIQRLYPPDSDSRRFRREGGKGGRRC